MAISFEAKAGDRAIGSIFENLPMARSRADTSEKSAQLQIPETYYPLRSEAA